MSDEFILAYAAGAVGVVAATLVVYVYKTVSGFEAKWHRASERVQETVHTFQSIDLSLRALNDKMKDKASYKQTEQRLAEATSRLLLKDKQRALAQLSDDVRVKVE